MSTDAGKPKLGSVREILKTKGEKFYSTSEDAMVFEAVKEMVSHNIGSLVIVDEDKRPIGIITERDYLEKVIVRGRSSKNTKVSEIMSTKEFTFVAPDSTLLEAMELMSKRKIRHVPVVEKRKMLGMISIGDVVKELVELHRKDAENMREFISGGY